MYPPHVLPLPPRDHIVSYGVEVAEVAHLAELHAAEQRIIRESEFRRCLPGADIDGKGFEPGHFFASESER